MILFSIIVVLFALVPTVLYILETDDTQRA